MTAKQRQTIGAAIKRLRDAEPITQTALADRLGISNVWLCEIESGRREPSLPLLRRIAAALGVGVGELLGE